MPLYFGWRVDWYQQAFWLKEVVLAALTALEKQIVILVAQGYTNREVAEKLCLAEQTVRNYVCAIYEKVGVKNRAGLTSYAWQQGWIDSAQEK